MTGDSFVVLGSGSSGNCTFVGSPQGGFLIDCGFDDRIIASRLAMIGTNWHHIQGVILTHTHTDHWKALALNQLKIHKIPFYIHALHRSRLSQLAPEEYDDLIALNLIREFQALIPFQIAQRFSVTPILVPHDCDPTFAFRINGASSKNDDDAFRWSIGYASDLGQVPDELLNHFTNVQIIAMEFNHDEQMQKQSGRTWELIRRVLSDQGHLSNTQAANAVETIIRQSRPHVVRYVVPLHLSRDCNRESLARDAARKALDRCGSRAEIIPARPDTPTVVMPLGEGLSPN
ncbi:MAG: MBL fold metallo-hydrolase [Gemmataceae bacterium]|jgi:phosphoribosyl 1,2-cyclic phosphodiesterase|nr:MBL fold metallo-hydrolase [Gemmataceae bacterium]